ncbi:MAG: hypothetical protein MUC50_12045 [Myxococcota bacterium]|jgi:ActR/RegA family two-component response regulator|nr:hypothetical protein [Myxococcota bacterium]
MFAQDENAAGQNPSRLILLVVDDEKAVCRAVGRVMKRRFDEVLTADSAEEAHAILSTRAVTHIVCDHWFGKGQALGLDLVTEWVKTYGSLVRVLLLTGVDITQMVSPDPKVQIISKTADAADLVRELGVR